MEFTLKVWKQKNNRDKGNFETFKVENISPDMSFLEMFDILNEQLLKKNKDPIAFDSDCREGICGMCSMYINGQPHGPEKGTTACQLHMRSFKNKDTIFVEPWRATPFGIIKDLVSDRTALDRIITAGGFISVNTGSATDANQIAIGTDVAEESMNSASCIGCGACVAACKNASAMLFVAAKIKHLNHLPQGKVEKKQRTIAMIAQMDKEGFGACTNTGACAAECPKEIPLTDIAEANKYYFLSKLNT